MFRMIRELKAPPKIVLARLSSIHRGSLRLTVKLPTDIDDWMLFGRGTKYTCRPVNAGAGVNAGFATSPRGHGANAFSTAENIASGSTAPTIRTNALFGR